MKKKILFYDCWARGVGHLISLINSALPKDKFQTKLLHFESLYNSGFPKFTKIKGLDCYDFSFYKTYNVRKILEKEKPDLVIFFDKRGLLDRAGVLAAKSLGIKTLQVQHGVEPSLSFEKDSSFFKNPYSLKFYFENIKQLTKMFSVYFVTAICSFPLYFLNPQKWKYLIWLLVAPKKHYFLYSDEVKCDQILAFGQKDKAYHRQIGGYQENEIRIIGNLFLDEAARLFNKNKPRKNKRAKKALLVTSPLVEDKVVGWGAEVRKNFLLTIFKILRAKKIKLTIKIHPRENLNTYKNIFSNIKEMPKITKDEDLNRLILASDFVIGIFSSALANAVVLGKPIIIADWQKVGFSKIYHQGGVARLSKHIYGFKEILDDLEKGIFVKNYQLNRKKFIRDFCYKDDGLAKERIVESINKMLITS